MAQRTLFTIGHSTRTWPEFLSLLKSWEIQQLIDVRTVPQSRAFPWFSRQRLEKSLPKSSIQYLHLPALGGFRHAKKDSPNTAWRNQSFRGYADYMQTPQFAAALKELNRHRAKKRVCIMCSEAVWWRCHRRLIADAETARGIPVKHLMNETTASLHEITDFAKVKKKKGRPPVITYPG